MRETYPIKIESITISNDFLVEFANLFERVYNEIKGEYSRLEYRLQMKNGREISFDKKEELKISKDLKEIGFRLCAGDKSITANIYLNNLFDSTISITSSDEVWNRGTAGIFNDLLKEHELKFNNWINKGKQKYIIAIPVGVILFIGYIIWLQLVDPSSRIIIAISMLTVIPSVGYAVSNVITYLFPKIEYSEMLRVKARKYLLTIILTIILGIAANAIYNLLI